MKTIPASTVALLLALAIGATASAQTPRRLMTANAGNSAESAWVRKPVLASRVLDVAQRRDVVGMSWSR